jgi:hypothetical protein
MSKLNSSPLAKLSASYLAFQPTLKPAKPADLGLTCRTHDGNTNGVAWTLLSGILPSLGSGYARLDTHKLSSSKSLAKLELGTISPDLAAYTVYASCRTALLPLCLGMLHAQLALRAGDAKPWERITANPMAALDCLPPALAKLDSMPALVASLSA